MVYNLYSVFVIVHEIKNSTHTITFKLHNACLGNDPSVEIVPLVESYEFKTSF